MLRRSCELPATNVQPQTVIVAQFDSTVKESFVHPT